MCEWIREYLMSRIAKQRVKLEAWPHRVMPKPKKRLDQEVEGSANWLAMWTGNGLEFQINHVYGSRAFIVDLNNKTCSCNFWQLVGIPCRHACAAICERQKKPEDFVDDCYTRYSYELAYNYGVSAINGQDMWPTVEVEDMLPPVYKRGPGRPKKLRRRQPEEQTNPKKLKRTGTSYKCTKCDKFGHNSRSCKSTKINPEAQKRKRKPKMGSATASAIGSGSGSASATASASATTTASATGSGSGSASATASASATTTASATVSASATTLPSATASASATTPASATASASASTPASATAPASVTASATVPASAPATVSARMPYKPPAQRIPKLTVKRTRFSTRVKRTVLPYTGPGSDPSKPVHVEDDEGSNKEYNDGCVTQEDPN